MKYLALITILYSSFVSANDSDIDCNNAVTTIEMNNCLAIELEDTENILTQYLQESIKQQSHDEKTVDAIRKSQATWDIYRETHCDAIYTLWREGTIRGVMSFSCSIRLTKQRIFELWSEYLTYMDSTPPVLPKPNSIK